MTWKKGIGQWKHYLTTLQANTRSPGYGCYCIKYKQWWDSVKLPYQIQAILNLKFAVSNTSNKRKASRWQVEGWWRETIDYKSNRSEILCWGSLYQIQAILSCCCIKYKQLAKGQKDDGRRETWQTINKQKLFVCKFVWLLLWLRMWHCSTFLLAGQLTIPGTGFESG